MAKISRELFMADARKKVREAYSSRDMLLTHTVNSIDELDKTINLFSERLREWYGIYFPEFSCEDPKIYSQIAISFDRKRPDKRLLSESLGIEKAEQTMKGAERSMGADLAQDDMDAIRALATEITSLFALRDTVEQYQSKVVKELAPNLCTLVEPKLAAGLIAQAGSLKRLANMPASTVQVLGAEKALFKHLRNHTQPPKHGLIFQHPSINNAPLSHRGKLARALAAKLAMAAKADALTHSFIGDALKADFERRAKEISSMPFDEKRVTQKPQFYGGRGSDFDRPNKNWAWKRQRHGKGQRR